MTAKQVADWILTLPPEFQNAQFTAWRGAMPMNLKRVVAARYVDGGEIVVIANPMGSHMPFDDSLKWEHTLSDPKQAPIPWIISDLRTSPSHQPTSGHPTP